MSGTFTTRFIRIKLSNLEPSGQRLDARTRPRAGLDLDGQKAVLLLSSTALALEAGIGAIVAGFDVHEAKSALGGFS
jgi:hypothetical protein